MKGCTYLSVRPNLRLHPALTATKRSQVSVEHNSAWRWSQHRTTVDVDTPESSIAYPIRCCLPQSALFGHVDPPRGRASWLTNPTFTSSRTHLLWLPSYSARVNEAARVQGGMSSVGPAHYPTFHWHLVPRVFCGALLPQVVEPRPQCFVRLALQFTGVSLACVYSH